jgi:hypothetical protein
MQSGPEELGGGSGGALLGGCVPSGWQLGVGAWCTWALELMLLELVQLGMAAVHGLRLVAAPV